jgi:hypothetical protein
MAFHYFKWLIAIVACAVLSPLTGISQATDDSKELRERPEFVVGDWYDVTIERHGVKEKQCGYLVKLTDDWVVIGVIQCACYAEAIGVPGLMDLPIIGDKFQKRETKEICCKAYSWIPRKSVVIEKHTEFDPKYFKPFQDEKLELGEKCFANWVDSDSGKPMSADGKFGELKDGCIGIVETQVERHPHKSSKLSRLPVVGSMFTSYESVEATVTKTISLDDLLYIKTQTLIDPSEVASADE